MNGCVVPNGYVGLWRPYWIILLCKIALQQLAAILIVQNNEIASIFEHISIEKKFTRYNGGQIGSRKQKVAAILDFSSMIKKVSYDVISCSVCIKFLFYVKKFLSVSAVFCSSRKLIK